jgi:GNAT superfamily N-acetyltransferase
MHWITFGDTAPQIDPAKGYWWLLFDKDDPERPAGFCGLTQSSYSQNFGYLKRSGVLEAHRGRGLQLRMIRVREAEAKKLGWSYVITDTTDNPASSNTLIRAGYKLFKPRYPWGPLAETLYWKRTINGQR